MQIAVIAVIAIFLLAVLVGVVSALGAFISLLPIRIVQGFAKMQIAKKMKVKRGWFAFIPFLSTYLEGKLAQASVAQRYPGVKPFRWGIFLAVFDVILYVVDILVYLPATLVLLLTNFYDLMLQSGVVFEFLPIDVAETLGLLSIFSGGAFAIVINALSAVVSIASIVLTICVFVARYKLLAAMTGDHKVWIFILEFFVSPARLVIDILLGFTPVFKKYQQNDESVETAEEPIVAAE